MADPRDAQQPQTPTGQRIADVYEFDLPGPLGSVRSAYITLDELRAIEAEAIAIGAKEVEGWLSEHSGHHLRYVAAEYEPAAMVCDDCEGENFCVFLAEPEEAL